uniref:Uncharacterized protein n=1 Tax=Sphaerodactylus townsendi TaxID=933632 RepID=A0ACB8FGJ0_9SAUR
MRNKLLEVLEIKYEKLKMEMRNEESMKRVGKEEETVTVLLKMHSDDSTVPGRKAVKDVETIAVAGWERPIKKLINFCLEETLMDLF